MSKVVFVTGASSGLGLTIANFLVTKGYKVYGTSRNPSNYPEIKGFQLLKLDVHNEDSIKNAIAYLLQNEKKIDVLICNAGLGMIGPAELVNIDSAKTLFETNFFGVLRVVQNVIPTMRQQKNGLIINVSSIAGYMGLPYRSIYSASKAALDKLTESLRIELCEFGINVCTLAPGSYATPITNRRLRVDVGAESPYHDTYNRIHKKINEDVDQGRDPNEVAQKIADIINQPSPNVHYRVGSNVQRLSIVLKNILPSKTYERLIRKHYNI